MKKILLLLFIGSATIGMAQNENDALRYSNIVPSGTAKFTSMSGAMGAVGGDLSAMTINPAGLAIYRKNLISASPVWSKAKVKSKYYDNSKTANKNKVKMSNIGFVSVFPTGNESGCKSVNFSFAYNQTGNLYRNVAISGYNGTTSILDGEVEWFNENRDENYALNKAGLFVYDSTTNQYYNDYYLADSYGAEQSKSIRSSGNVGEYTIALGANFNESFYFGGSVNIVHVNYEQTQKYSETPDDKNLYLQGFDITDYFQSIGTGVNVKLGFIYWLNDIIRFGAAVHTPTIMDMSDDYYTEVEANILSDDGSQVYLNGGYESGDYDWDLTMPGKFVGSAAFVFRNIGLIDVDCEVIDYSGALLDDFDGNFESVNDKISDIYRTAVNLRVGGELSMGILALRAGFGYYGSPYVSSHINSSANKYVYSFGVSKRGENAFFDCGYAISTCKDKHSLYNDDSAVASIKSKYSNLVFTIGFKF